MKTQQNKNQVHDESISEYEKVLGITGNYTAEDVLNSFLAAYEKRVKNNQINFFSSELEAKNKILQNLISKQMKVQKYFEITSPFVNSCIACRGTGEIYRFAHKTVKINCHICAGKKKIKEGCPDCKGVGRIVKKWDGGGYDIECRKCKGTGKVEVKCAQCLGEGKKKKMVLSHVIKSTTPCKVCGRLGFTSNKTQKKKKKQKSKPYAPGGYAPNPVLSHELATIIKKSIDKSTS